MSGRDARLAGAVARGLRARASLTAGSLLLASVAVAAAVLGPLYEAAASQSFLVTRLDDATPVETGASFNWTPAGPLGRDVGGALAKAPSLGSEELDNNFGSPSLTLVSHPVALPRVFDLAYPGEVRLLSKDGICQAVEVEGRCPVRPGETALLKADADFIGVSIGDHIRYPGVRGGLEVVGTYTVPDDAEDFLFDETRYQRIPPVPTLSGVTAYTVAPLLVTQETFDELGGWNIDVDRPLLVPPDITPEDVHAAQRTVASLEPTLKASDPGTFVVSEDNLLDVLLKEIDANRTTARDTVVPAVVSVVLVALALLVRLLGAAADQRRAELALGTMRGMGRRQLWVFGLAEPLTIVAVAAPVGVALGYVTGVVLARIWLVPGVPVSVGPASVAAAVLILVAAAAGTAVTVGRALGETLASQLAGVRRPTRSSRWAFIGKAVVVIAATVVVVGSATASHRSSPQSSDVVLPLLLGAAAGLGASAGTVWAAGWWTRRSGRRPGVTGYVASRAVSRRREASLVIVPLTAALAIAVFSAGVYGAASSWRYSAAATQVGADESYESPLTLAQTVALTHRLDPEGKWLMAAGVIDDAGVGQRLAIDTSRLDRVGVWPSTWTPGVSVADVAKELSPSGPPLSFSGRELALTVDNEVDSGGKPLGFSYTLRSLETGVSTQVFLGPYPSGAATRSVKVGFCANGCEIASMMVGGVAVTAVRMDGSFKVTDLSADGTAVPRATDTASWRTYTSYPAGQVGTATVGKTSPVTVSVDTGGSPNIAGITPTDVPAVRPVLTGTQADEPLLASNGSVDVLKTRGGGGMPVHSVGEAESMPFLGPSGTMIDYEMIARDDAIPDDATQAYVLARDDTPASVLTGLRDEGVSSPTSLDQVKHVLDQDAYALSLNLYLVAAFVAVALAAAGLAVTLLVQLPDRRRDAAALRVVGVRRRSIVRAVLVEISVVLGVAGLVGIAAGAVAQLLVVRTLTLGLGDLGHVPRVVPTLDLRGLTIVTVGVVAVLVAAAGLVASASVRNARASTLRETVR